MCFGIYAMKFLKINHYSETCLERPAMRDHLSCQTTHFWQDLHVNITEPVTREHLSWQTTFLWPMGRSFKTGFTVLQKISWHKLDCKFYFSSHDIPVKLICFQGYWLHFWNAEAIIPFCDASLADSKAGVRWSLQPRRRWRYRRCVACSSVTLPVTWSWWWLSQSRPSFQYTKPCWRRSQTTSERS